MTGFKSMRQRLLNFVAGSACVAVIGGALTYVARPVLAAAPARSAGAWHPAACPPPPDGGKGPSKMKITGPCAVDITGEALCEAEFDDMTAIVTRKAKNGAELMLFINVERYAGAGTYKAPNDIFVGLKDKTTMYRWASNDFEATIGPGSRFVTLNNVKLEPELPLIKCTGPQTNYQCDDRGNDPGHMASITTVSGTLYCKGGGPKK